MRIDAVGLNRPLNRMQGPIKKVAGVAKPLTMALTEMDESPFPEAAETLRGKTNGMSKHPLDTLGSQVDVWA